MTVAVGQVAPAFHLPSGQGPEVALADYRDKKNVIVWFTKGMACPFCRQQMSQLARVYPQFAARDTEIVEVASSTLDRARVYTQKFGLRFPYLCDSDYSVRRAWGLGVRSHGPVYYAKAFYMGITAPKVETEFVGEPFKPTELPRLLTDEDMGFFIVDKAGVVRYALRGSYVTATGARQIPSNAEILQELDRCAQPASPSA